MGKGILIINKKQVHSLRERLTDPNKLADCIEEVRKMIDIKSCLSWRADARSNCCGPEIQMYLYGEVTALESILAELKSGNIETAKKLLNDFETMIYETAGGLGWT